MTGGLITPMQHSQSKLMPFTGVQFSRRHHTGILNISLIDNSVKVHPVSYSHVDHKAGSGGQGFAQVGIENRLVDTNVAVCCSTDHAFGFRTRQHCIDYARTVTQEISRHDAVGCSNVPVFPYN